MAADTSQSAQACMHHLLPLAQQSLQNALEGDLHSTLTGPIARGDLETITKHQGTLMSLSPHFIRLYNALTAAIQKHLEWEKEIE